MSLGDVQLYPFPLGEIKSRTVILYSKEDHSEFKKAIEVAEGKNIYQGGSTCVGLCKIYIHSTAGEAACYAQELRSEGILCYEIMDCDAPQPVGKTPSFRPNWSVSVSSNIFTEFNDAKKLASDLSKQCFQSFFVRYNWKTKTYLVVSEDANKNMPPQWREYDSLSAQIIYSNGYVVELTRSRGENKEAKVNKDGIWYTMSWDEVDGHDETYDTPEDIRTAMFEAWNKYFTERQ